jgi:alkanesulfonate monooxygenase SsuD/methylene tetrahydromethanopterin reductase-like flavin-dependent oxidoreductase (luciferase family)
MAATLDRVSNGRLRMLVGAGWFEQEYRQYGYDFPSPGTRIGELRDTIRILKGLLGPHESFSYSGDHYSVADAVNLPLPVQQPFPIEIGGAGDRLMRTVAFMGDGWNSPGAALGMLDSRLALLAATMEERGRSMDELRLSCQIVCAIDDEQSAQHPAMAMFNPQLGFVGSVDDAATRARELIAKGVTDFNCVVAPGPKGRAALEKLVEARSRL